MAATNLITLSTTQTASGASSTADASTVAQVAADFTVAVLTPNTTLNFYVERQGNDSQWYVVWESGPITVAPSQPSMPPALTGIPGTVRVRWTLVGNAGSPSATFTASVVGSGVGTGGTSSATLAAATAGGATKAKVRNLAATVTAIKASAGTLYGFLVVNNQAAAAWVQIFDLATGSVTLGTTTPDLEVQAASNTSVTLTLPAVGVNFGTAISVASATAEGGGTGSAAGVHVFALYA